MASFLTLPNGLPPPDPFSVIGVIVLSTVFYIATLPSRSKLPLVNNLKALEFRSAHARRRFVAHAQEFIKAGFAKSNNAFRIVGDSGYMMVLSPEYAEELRDHPNLSFGKAVAKEFNAHLQGFEPFNVVGVDNQIFQDAVRMKLTQALGRITLPLSEETAAALKKNWTDNSEWHEIELKSSLLRTVAQLSSKVFLGDEICRNPDWLRITVEYSVDSFMAAESLRIWPKMLRPVASKFLPRCRKVRAEMEEARQIITPVLEKRRAEKRAALKLGSTPKRYNDAMEWMEESAKGRQYDPAVGQMAFSVAAIHTTSDMMTQVIYDLCGKDDLIHGLREEIIAVLSQDGWKKTALYKLKLMDSMLKESQRLKPMSIVSMRRVATGPITLSDGTKIPKDTSIMVSAHKMWDEVVYTRSDEFDPQRFLRMKDIPGKDTFAHFVSPSVEHMGFGFGRHACPGRFFAANEIKIALCHILLKYDFKLAEAQRPEFERVGVSLNANSRAKILVRRREEEIPLL